MTAPVTSYSTTEAVRSCLGVTDNEMSDEFMLEQGLSSSVLIALERWLPDHADHWAASQGNVPSAAQITVGRCIKLYCQWAGAYHAIQAYLAVPHEISDGKSSISRFANDGAKRAEGNCSRMMSNYKQIVQDTLSPDSYVPASVMGIASPSSDPVTGGST